MKNGEYEYVAEKDEERMTKRRRRTEIHPVEYPESQRRTAVLNEGGLIEGPGSEQKISSQAREAED